MKPAIVALAVASMLSACAIGPNYQRPVMELPDAYAASAQKPAAVVAPASWWTLYNDEALNRLVDETLKNNLDLKVAASRISEARSQLGLAVSDQLPSVYATASRERNRNSEASSFGGQGQPIESTTNRATLNVSWELDFWGKYRRATEAARADLLAVEANRDGLRLSLVAQVAQGYFNLVALDSRIAATGLAIKRGQEALDLQKKRFDAGVISEFDYQQRAAEVDAARAQLPPLQSQLGAQERALSVLLGRSPRAVMESKVERSGTHVPVAAAVVAPAGVPSDLLLRRPDLVESEQRLMASNARIGVARAAFFPSITLTGFLGSESSSLSDLFSGPARVWNFAGGLTQPLWGASRINKQVDAAEARNEQSVAQYRNAIANAFREVQDAIQSQSAAREVYEIEQRRVTSLSKTWDLAKLRYANGIASQLDVIDAERNLLMAELSRIEAERTLRTAVADFYKALGG
ncbi:MAG: efflux transporter outer membrane subunit [Betaproteobacteria bacterium]|nr:efflux transporter outer membrane subunit [Betaproteobacteria bacterium]